MYDPVPIHPALAAHVREIRVQDPAAVAPADPGPYRVLPGPFPVLGFQSRGRLRALRDGRAEFLSPAGVTGLQRTVRRFHADADTRTVLVVLHPAGAFPLLGAAMDEVADAHVGLASLLPVAEVAEVEERLAAAASVAEASRAVQSFLLARLERSRHAPHPAVIAAARRLLESRGRERIDALARSLGIGRRQLERLFRRQVGTPPKELASLARFEWAVRHLARRRSWADLAYEAGYADQAHFIRSFSARAGATPAELAGRAAPA